MTYEQIKNKKIELIQLQSKYKKEIAEMEWQYIKEIYDLEKGNILKYKDKYCIVHSISAFGQYLIVMKCLVIKKDTTIGKNTIDICDRNVVKEFDSYEEYKQALKQL